MYVGDMTGTCMLETRLKQPSLSLAGRGFRTLATALSACTCRWPEDSAIDRNSIVLLARKLREA